MLEAGRGGRDVVAREDEDATPSIQKISYVLRLMQQLNLKAHLLVPSLSREAHLEDIIGLRFSPSTGTN